MFIDARLNDNLVIYATSGGPTIMSTVVTMPNGVEYRNEDFADKNGRWDIGDRVCSISELHQMQKHFRVVGGKVHSFGFKDWADYVVTNDGVVSKISTNTFQLQKKYEFGGLVDLRTITKPVAGTVRVSSNGNVIPDAVVDYTKGIVTLPNKSATVNSLSSANRAVVGFTAPHGFVIGDAITFSGMTAATDLNGTVHIVTAVPSPTSIEIDFNSTSEPAFASIAGVVSAFYADENVSWTGEFDVCVRFDAFELKSRFEAMSLDTKEAIHYLFSLPIVECRYE